MKKRIITWLCLLLMGFTACMTPDEYHKDASEKTQEETIDYDDVEEMEEVTVEGNRVTFALYENQALPYRWSSVARGDGITLVLDENVDGKGSLFAAGVSPSYHVFTYELGVDGEMTVELIYARIDSSDSTDLGEGAKIRTFFLTKQGDTVTYVEQ